jgi:hypothetical protein
MSAPIPIACDLDQAGRAARRDDLAALGKGLTAIAAESTRARLRFASGQRPALERFVEAESACCPFFEFRVIADGDAVELRVEGPEGSDWAVRGLVAGFVAGWEGLV